MIILDTDVDIFIEFRSMIMNSVYTLRILDRISEFYKLIRILMKNSEYEIY